VAIKSYRDLETWQEAMNLVETCYRLTALLPSEEKFGLTTQIRRAAVSVPANIAEGYGRTHRGDYTHHLSIAKGSVAEVETLLMLTARLNLVTSEDVRPAWEQAQTVARLLTRLQQSLSSKQPNPKP
jgi:four helix bundle protein